MTRNTNRGRKARHAAVRRSIPTDPLEAMIEEAIVDAQTESEQAVGFHATIEQHLELPFETAVLGVAVTLKKVDVTSAGENRHGLLPWARRTGLPDSRLVAAGSTTGRLGMD